MRSEVRTVRTGGVAAVVDLTDECTEFVRKEGDGLLHVFVPHATVPVLEGRLMLGTWQRICLVDTNVDNPQRQVRLSFLPG